MPKSSISLLFGTYVAPGQQDQSHRGWEIYELALVATRLNIEENYGNIECSPDRKWMGVEGGKNSRKDGVIQRRYRIDFCQRPPSRVRPFKMVPTVKAI